MGRTLSMGAGSEVPPVTCKQWSMAMAGPEHVGDGELDPREVSGKVCSWPLLPIRTADMQAGSSVTRLTAHCSQGLWRGCSRRSPAVEMHSQNWNHYSECGASCQAHVAPCDRHCEMATLPLQHAPVPRSTGWKTQTPAMCTGVAPCLLPPPRPRLLTTVRARAFLRGHMT